ncbi:hypothetical protein Efla_004965 [Eimeria flavescens]
MLQAECRRCSLEDTSKGFPGLAEMNDLEGTLVQDGGDSLSPKGVNLGSVRSFLAGSPEARGADFLPWPRESLDVETAHSIRERSGLLPEAVLAKQAQAKLPDCRVARKLVDFLVCLEVGRQRQHQLTDVLDRCEAVEDVSMLAIPAERIQQADVKHFIQSDCDERRLLVFFRMSMPLNVPYFNRPWVIDMSSVVGRPNVLSLPNKTRAARLRIEVHGCCFAFCNMLNEVL